MADDAGTVRWYAAAYRNSSGILRRQGVVCDHTQYKLEVPLARGSALLKRLTDGGPMLWARLAVWKTEPQIPLGDCYVVSFPNMIPPKRLTLINWKLEE